MSRGPIDTHTAVSIAIRTTSLLRPASCRSWLLLALLTVGEFLLSSDEDEDDESVWSQSRRLETLYVSRTRGARDLISSLSVHVSRGRVWVA